MNLLKADDMAIRGFVEMEWHQRFDWLLTADELLALNFPILTIKWRYVENGPQEFELNAFEPDPYGQSKFAIISKDELRSFIEVSRQCGYEIIGQPEGVKLQITMKKRTEETHEPV